MGAAGIHSYVYVHNIQIKYGLGGREKETLWHTLGKSCDHLENLHDRDKNTEGQRGEETPQDPRVTILLHSAPPHSVKE